MGIHPIEGYQVICDKCGKVEEFTESSEYKSSLEIDQEFSDWLEEKGYVIIGDRVFCRECAPEQ